MANILDEIFYSQNKHEDPRNPTDPLNSAYFNKERDIENKAFIYWQEECGGERLMKNLKRDLIHLIQTIATQDTTTVEGVLKLVQMKTQLKERATVINRMMEAFEEEEKRQEEIKNQ